MPQQLIPNSQSIKMDSSSHDFPVRKKDAVLISPSQPTPRELKRLSLIDDQMSHRLHAKGAHVYSSHCKDPAGLLRDALAKALVLYYPFAGRLREIGGQRLAVDCTGEGVLFTEAEADIGLDQLLPYPPFPEDLVAGVGTADFLNAPLLAVQLTRLRDGGIVLSHSTNHVMADAAGVAQFFRAVGELARGKRLPTIMPVWQRELLMPRNPPSITHAHPEYDLLPPEPPQPPNLVKSLFFGPREVTALQQQLPPEFRATRFELLTAALWRSSVLALDTADDEEVRARFPFNVRSKCTPVLPEGYYGNAGAYVVLRTSARELKQGSFKYAVELVKEGKNSIKDGYLQSAVDLLAQRGPMVATARTLSITDLGRLGYADADFGWGRPLYAGGVISQGASKRMFAYSRFRSSNGEEGVLATLTFPIRAMQRFEQEIHRLIQATALSAQVAKL